MERVSCRPLTSSDSLGQPWTAKRCHRLLRPLQTHIAALRKEVNRRCSTKSFGYDSSQDESRSDALGSNSEGLGADSRGLRSRTRLRRTYSLKASKTAKGPEEREDARKDCRTVVRRHDVPLDGTMYLATPVVRRAQGQFSSPPEPQRAIPYTQPAVRPGRCYHSHQLCNHKCVFEAKLASLRRTTAPSMFSLYESIYRALDALLRATSAREPSTTAPKSLLAICLRKVPDYLAELELWNSKEEAVNGTISTVDDSNTSFDLYSELESLGTGNCGWKHLATVVQSHGIKIVKEAILEGLIDNKFALVLVDLCSQTKALADRHQLLEAVLTRQHRKPRGPEDNFSLGEGLSKPLLEYLHPSGDRKWAWPFKAALMSDLLSRGLLPREWLLTTQFCRVWSAAMKNLASRTAGHDTITFFVTAIELLCDQTQSGGRRNARHEESLLAAERSLVSSLATLSTLAIIAQESLTTESDCNRRTSVTALCQRPEYIIRACLANVTGSHGKDRYCYRSYVLLLAAFSASLFMVPSETNQYASQEEIMLADFWGTVSDSSENGNYQQYYEATIAMLVAIARNCTLRKAHKPAAHTYLIKLCDKLESVCSGVAALRNIRVDAAFYLADQTGDLLDLHFAESLAAKSHNVSKTIRNTPGKCSVLDGFRWDEGLSEWVTVTPVPARRKQAVTLSIDDKVLRSRHPSPRADQADIRQNGDTVCASKPDRRHLLEDIFEHTVSSGIRTSPPAGTSRHARKRATRQDAKATRDEPGVQTETPGQGTRESPAMVDGSSMIDSQDDDDVDELRFDQATQENRPRRKRTMSEKCAVKRKRSRRSMLSLRPLRDISNEYYDDGSSGDELGL